MTNIQLLPLVGETLLPLKAAALAMAALLVLAGALPVLGVAAAIVA